METTAPVLVPTFDLGSEQLYIELAREIAMDMRPIEDILKAKSVTTKQWEVILATPRFQRLLESAVEEWGSTLNTGERVRLKALTAVEMAIPEFYARMHDNRENLPAKVKALEILGNIGGMGKNVQAQQSNGGERFSVTINLGGDEKLKITAPEPNMIDVSDR